MAHCECPDNRYHGAQSSSGARVSIGGIGHGGFYPRRVDLLGQSKFLGSC
jgi:hypothetical protein